MIRTHKIFCLCLVILFTGLLFSTPGSVWADEVTDSVEEAMEYYKEGDFVEAANSLDYASQLIRQKRSGNLEVFLPDPLSGWAAEDINFRSDITGTFSIKLKALLCHKSQMIEFKHIPDMEKYLRNRCQENAEGEKYELAEAFHRVALPG